MRWNVQLKRGRRQFKLAPWFRGPPPIMPNLHESSIIFSAFATATILLGATIAGMSTSLSNGYTQSDSHANFAVVARWFCTLYEDTKKQADACVFADNQPSVHSIPICNVLVAHDDEFSSKTIICGIQNALL